MPLVSVIIPAYNSEKTIAATVSSILQQTFRDFEVIVVDDGSTDSTRQYIQSIQDPRVKIFSYENGGLASARNRGIVHASGDYISFIDDDDLWTPDKLAAQLDALQKAPDAGVAYSWTLNMYSDEDPVRFTHGCAGNFEGNVYIQILLSNFVGCGSNILARRTAIESVGEFDGTLPSVEDRDFYIRLASKWNFVVVPKYQILYRRRSNSMSLQVQLTEKSGIKMIDKAYRTAPEQLQHYKKISLSNQYFHCSELYWAKANSLEGPEYRATVKEVYRTIGMAIRLRPAILGRRTTIQFILKLFYGSMLPLPFSRNLKKQLKRYFSRAAVDPDMLGDFDRRTFLGD